MHGALPGSSAGGEQPKFCTIREDGHPVIVKLSPAGGSAPERRWAGPGSARARCRYTAAASAPAVS